MLKRQNYIDVIRKGQNDFDIIGHSRCKNAMCILKLGLTTVQYVLKCYVYEYRILSISCLNGLLSLNKL